MPEYNWISEQIFTVSEFFSPEECDAYIELSESMGYADAPINTAMGPMIRQDVRNNTRVMLDDLPRADDLWSRIQDYIPHKLRSWSSCGVNERLRFYRYDVGQQFDWHYDGCFERDNGERSFLTFMVYLNDGFTGGETTIEEIDIKPEKGMALFFIHQIRHKGQPVTGGRKYVLRTDVMYRYNQPD
ncbi:MAG: hypothetical protein COA78_19870 [Blastopirellula sp.]|nr:MAG: hypothetical protein COA78_19870 [Blastopirellula sp.]